jgi:rhodanese-related sulfurtransferase
MVGVSYGKGASLPEQEVRWLAPEDVEALQQKGLTVRLFDARDRKEWELGSIPGAELLPQTGLMFTRNEYQPLIDGLLSSATDSAVEHVFFANTAGEGNGMTAGRDVFVMAFLRELGVPLERMARLKGGYHGWKASGRPCPLPLVADGPVADGLESFLEQAGLMRLHNSLSSGLTLSACTGALAESRAALLNLLKELGLGCASSPKATQAYPRPWLTSVRRSSCSAMLTLLWNGLTCPNLPMHSSSPWISLANLWCVPWCFCRLADRQAFCNAFAKAQREGRVVS